MILRLICGSILMYFLASCDNTSIPMPPLDYDPEVEVAEGIEMIYSDSAKLKFIIRTPRLEKYVEDRILVERFPQGIHIEFYDRDQNIKSTMQAKYAERRSYLGTLMLQDSVILSNAQHDQLTTLGITWNEIENTLTTDKFVRLIKAASGDTLYGYGMHARDDFSRINIRELVSIQRAPHQTTP